MRARALYDFVAEAANGELSFKEGDVIEVTNTEGGDGWWEGRLGKESGIFPENYVEILPEAEGAVPLAATDSSFSLTQTGVSETDEWADEGIVRNVATLAGHRASVEPDMDAGRPARLTRSDSQTSVSRMSVMGKGDEDLLRAANVVIEMSSTGLRWRAPSTPITVTIADPEKRAKLKGIKEFVAYKVTSTPGVTVERRFKHFAWLHERIAQKFSIMVYGALPEKQLNGRFEDDFIERRRQALERYINRLARHPVIGQSSVFQHFISCTDEKLWKAGKRAAERDAINGKKLYLTVAPPPLQGKPDGDADSARRFTKFYKSFARDTTELLDAFEAFQLSMDQVRKQYNRLSLATGALIGRNQRPDHGALNDAGVWDSRKGLKDCKGLTAAVGSVASAYLEMASAHGSLRKKMIEPFTDHLREYQSFLPICANIMDIHRNTIIRMNDAHRMPDRGKEMFVRGHQIFSANFAEINNFHEQRRVDFADAFRELLRSEIAHHQQAITILTSALNQFNDV